MGKQDEKDLFAINYRFQGVAEKIPEKQETVLGKLIKLRVRYKRALDGAGCEDLIDLGGYLQKI
jgi:hypothetical protein